MKFFGKALVSLNIKNGKAIYYGGRGQQLQADIPQGTVVEVSSFGASDHYIDIVHEGKTLVANTSDFEEFEEVEESVYYLKDCVDFPAIAKQLQTKSPSLSLEQISEAFQKFFWADERSEFWYYSKTQCLKVLEEIKVQFIQEVFPSQQKVYTPAGRVARDTDLELIGEPTSYTVQSNGWV